MVSYTKQQAVSVSGIDEKLKKENDALKLQKEQLEEEQSELINEAVDSSENSSSVKEENSPNQEELKQFITD